MKELPLALQRSVRKYEPVTIDGLTLFPVLVREYDELLVSKAALEVLHQSLPVRFMRIPLLSAFYQMDYEAATSGQPPTGLFSRALLGLALSLRLGEGQETQRRLEMFRVLADPKEPHKLIGLRCMLRGEEIIQITPAQYQKLRPVIAAQNGVKLESDRADPDLVQAEKDLADMNGVPLEAKIEDLICAVSALSGTEEREIEEWPILKLINRQKSYQRLLDYVICGVGQVSGKTWKGGNPHPSPFFDRAEKGGFGAHMALGDFAGGAGERAVANQGQKVY